MKEKLLDVCDFQGGTQPPKEEWINEPREGYIRMLQIRDYSQGDEKFIEYVKDSKKLHKCKKEDIMLSRYGYIGQAFMGLEGAYNVALVKVIKLKDINTKYLLYYFKSKMFQHYLLNNVGARATIPGFNKTELENAFINIPPLEEQQYIANMLEKVEIIIEKRKAELEVFDDLIKARFVELFGNPVINDKGWEQKPLGEITTKIGSGATPKGGKEAYQEEGITLIRSMNVHNGQFEYKDLAHISDEQAAKLDNVIIEENDVLLNITGASVARSCVVPIEILPARVNQHVCIIRCKDCIIPEFLNKLLIDDNYQDLLWNIAGSGATREAITKQQVENLQIILPPIEIQEEFMAFCKQVDKSKFAVA